MGRVPPSTLHTYVTPRRVRQVCGHVGVYLLLSRGPRRLQDPRSFSTSVIWTSFFQDFNFRFLQNLNLWLFSIIPFHLRIAMMAQAVFPCNLFLNCRVQVVDASTIPLLAEMRCGSYGVIQAGP